MIDAMNQVIQKYSREYKDKINSQNVASSISVVIAPFMVNVLSKYSEADFHMKMAQRYIDEQGKLCFGFDFIADWRDQHPYAFNIMTYFSRTLRNQLNFDVEIATDMVVDIIRAWKWHISAQEQKSIHHLLYRIKRIIRG